MKRSARRPPETMGLTWLGAVLAFHWLASRRL